MKCDDCGRFISEPKSWADIYDFAAYCCDHTHFRCEKCHDKLGPAESNARPHNGDMTTYQGIN